MKNISLLIKPASNQCNMHCRYCFYQDVASKREIGNLGLMSHETAENVVRAAMEAAQPGGTVQFAFQGGEPTLAGLAFYRDFVALEAAYSHPNVTVTHAIQTNGLSIDAEWAEFFRKNRFLVGISVDGPRDLHDFHRPDAGGKGTWGRVSRAVALLQKHHVETNLLCVVTRQCAHSPQRTYNALKKMGSDYLQFVPCLDPLGEQRGEKIFSITPADYGKFLCTLFDAWYLDWKQGTYVSIRLFDDYVHLAMGLPAGTCSTTGSCGAYSVVEADGGLYPCDFYAVDQWRLGQVGVDTLTSARTGALSSQFCAESQIKPTACADCDWRHLCNGGCKRDWVQTDHGPENYLCSAFQQFFAYAQPRLAEIAREEERYPYAHADALAKITNLA